MSKLHFETLIMNVPKDLIFGRAREQDARRAIRLKIWVFMMVDLEEGVLGRWLSEMIVESVLI